MQMNAGELRSAQTRGNLGRQMRKIDIPDEAATNSITQDLERSLFTIYDTQLRLATISLLIPEGEYPENWFVEDWSMVETLLRQGLPCAIGRDGSGRIRLLSISNMADGISINDTMNVTFGGVTGNGGIWDDLTQTTLYPITALEPDKGDYVVLTNKNIRAFLFFGADNYTNATMSLAGMSDEDLIYTTALRMAKSRATAFQNMEQMRSSMVFTSKNKNVTGGKVVQRWLNGYPIIGVDESYHVDDSIQALQGSPVLGDFIQSLRTENDYLLGDFFMWLGVGSSGSLKESGVTEFEAVSKLQAAESFAEIYLSARDQPLARLCHRFGGNLHMRFNQQSAQAIENLMETQEAETVAQRAEAQQALNEAKMNPNGFPAQQSKNQ